YGVGLWYNDNDIWWGGDSELISESGLDRLKENGANSITLFWRPLESLSAGPGRYDPKLSDRLDEIFGWCEARGIHIAWNLWFHSFLSQTVWSGWDSIWDTHAYSKITRALDFYADSTAWAYQKKLYRYIIARWGYSTSLYLWFVIDEIDGTEGWGKGDTLAAQNWGRNVRDFFRANDPWQRPTTGTKCGHVDRYWPGGCEIFDVAAREIYESQGWPMPDPTQLDNGKADPLKCSYNNYAGEIRKMWGSYAKPLIIGESGWNSTFYKPGTPGYLATYHNALWVSLASGLAATPFWWEYFDFINEQVVTSQMKYFARFVSDIDLAGRHWLPAKVQADGGADAFGMQSGDQAFGWVVNPDKSLYRASISISGLADGKYEVRIYNPWNGEYIEPQKMTCSGGRLT
ncbi:MAG TPA: hypothetical protein VJ417_16050, partial [Candidatus Glassbacteria bacterium]|nr:hypothetical protein [Candidatus Glassbacteria bacterium]